VQRSFMVTGGHVPGVAIVVGAVGALSASAEVSFDFGGEPSGSAIGSEYGNGHVAYSYEPEIVNTALNLNRAEGPARARSGALYQQHSSAGNMTCAFAPSELFPRRFLVLRLSKPAIHCLHAEALPAHFMRFPLSRIG
jgi:hypothetical protein